MVEKLLKNTGATVRSREMMYKSVVQTVLLDSIKSWVVTEVMLKVMEGLNYRVARRIAGISDQKVGEWVWEWSLVAEDL